MSIELFSRFNKLSKKNKINLLLFVLEGYSTIDLAEYIKNGSKKDLTESILGFSSTFLIAFLLYKFNCIKEKNKEEYMELKKIYDEYLDSLANLILTMKFDSTLELCVFLDNLMSKSYFSITDDFEYKKFIYNRELYSDLLGTAVLTGRAVCRHNTAFMNDLLNRLNVKTFEINNYGMGTKKKLIRHGKYNHVMTGIIEKNKVWAYDFTGHFPGKILDQRTVCSYPLFEEEAQIYYSIVNDNKIGDYLKLESSDIDINELEKIIVSNIDRYIDYSDMLYAFKKGYMETMEDIASKNLKLMPRR